MAQLFTKDNTRKISDVGPSRTFQLLFHSWWNFQFVSWTKKQNLQFHRDMQSKYFNLLKHHLSRQLWLYTLLKISDCFSYSFSKKCAVSASCWAWRWLKRAHRCLTSKVFSFWKEMETHSIIFLHHNIKVTELIRETKAKFCKKKFIFRSYVRRQIVDPTYWGKKVAQ